ncbi:hypothetical protein E2493_06180 [Sphingomonas parva]|uniref:Uncharacterized protein n=1 Tax=Sphingomonas parva TaxID=2555898 RepID=A0A4Y8ZSW5_9SPHN|nr:hypothetical protein [Sphingomonas parva]TFI59110.1 hypothetical protein E2493_06180 [Sphingomonas parva]
MKVWGAALTDTRIDLGDSGERGVPYYRLCFSSDGRAGCFDEFPAVDDAAALREAQRHVETGHAALWCEERLVATVTAGAGDRPDSAGRAVPNSLRLRLLGT